MTHELTMKQNMEDEAKKRKMITLKSTAKEEESEDSEEGDEDEKMA